MGLRGVHALGPAGCQRCSGAGGNQRGRGERVPAEAFRRLHVSTGYAGLGSLDWRGPQYPSPRRTDLGRYPARGPRRGRSLHPILVRLGAGCRGEGVRGAILNSGSAGGTQESGTQLPTSGPQPSGDQPVSLVLELIRHEKIRLTMSRRPRKAMGFATKTEAVGIIQFWSLLPSFAPSVAIRLKH